MANDLDEQSSKGFDLQHYLGLVRRRHLHFLIPFFLGWVAVWAASWVLPARYQSTTLILVTQPTMPAEYIKPNVTEDLQERLQSITQQIMSRTRLLHIIDQFDLYAAPHTHWSPDEKVVKMRKDINIELVRGQDNQITAFNLSYGSRNALQAQKVTSELTNLFINENLKATTDQSEDITKFLQAQLENARNTLAAQEDKIRQFQSQHVGEMPGQLASNLQILTGLQAQFQNEEDALNSAKQQHVYLQTLIEQYKALQGSAKPGNGTTMGLPAINQELEKLKSQLADLRSRYTDQYPEVRKLKEQIAQTEKMRDQFLAGLKDKSSSPSDAGDTSGEGQSLDPVQASMLLQVQSQLRSNQVEIANREQAVAGLKTKIDNYQARLNAEPIREQELADLTRGYEQSKATYDDLLKKKNESAMATSVVIAQQGERFTVVDPPSLPQKPEFPNRLKFCAIGLGLGVALGGVFAGAFEMMDDRVHNQKELRKLLPPDIIAEIPAIITTTDSETARRKIWLGWATAAFVFAVILAGSAFSYLRG